jgi:hypothetical protein
MTGGDAARWHVTWDNSKDNMISIARVASKKEVIPLHCDWNMTMTFIHETE